MQTYDIPAGTIAVGVDGSPSSERALAWAADQALADGRALTLVHAVSPSGAVWMDQSGHETRFGLEAVKSAAQQLLTQARHTVELRTSGLEVHEVLRVADPRDLLLDVSGHAGMVVLGSRRRGIVRSLLLGSVSAAVTRHASCPVVVLRPHNGGLLRRRILVGVDGTEGSQAPLEFAFRQASQRGLPLTVVHAFHEVLAPVIDSPPVYSVVVGDVEEQRSLLAETTSGMREKFPDVPVRTELARGYAGDCLVGMSYRMSLVVVGAHNGGAGSAIVFGSVASSVVEHASCPVAVVPIGAPGDGG